MEITPEIKALIKAAFQEDLNNAGDITTQATIPADTTITAVMNAREDGIIAGTHLSEAVFKTYDDALDVTLHVQDGDVVKSGQKILTVSGNARNILSSERVALNFLTHLSGIATETGRYVEAVKHTNAKILDTRKTLPAYRTIQKHAVKMGGGTNHRIGLYDMLLIKDNHIAAAGGITQALDATKDISDVKIEIEVDTLDQLDEVIAHKEKNGGGADIVLLDNMPPVDLKTAVNRIQGNLIAEASGGVNMDTVVGIAESGVDLISIGALTHSVKVFDIGLDIG